MRSKVRQITVIIRDDTFRHLTQMAARKGYKKLGWAIDDLVMKKILDDKNRSCKGY